MRNGLLVGGQTAYLGELAEEVRAADISLFMANSLEDVKRILSNEAIDIVFLGWESDPEFRLHVLSYMLDVNSGLSIHLMGKGDEPLSFVSAIMLRNQPRDPDRNSKVGGGN
jgi:predicted GTPase